MRDLKRHRFRRPLAKGGQECLNPGCGWYEWSPGLEQDPRIRYSNGFGGKRILNPQACKHVPKEEE